MSAIGLGGFAKGFSEGFTNTASTIGAIQKGKREAEMFGLQKQSAELELEEKKREQAFQEDLKSSMAPIFQELQVSMNPPPAQNGLQGVQAQPQPLDLTALTRRFADTSLAVGFKHGKVTLDQLKQARDLRTTMDKENLDEAVQTWLTTGDKAQVAEIFNRGGKFKFDPATMDIQTVNDPDGLLPANVIVTRMGEDGKPVELFNYEKLAMAGISKEAYAQIVSAAKTTKLKEKNETFRTGMTTQATLQAASMKDGARQNPEVSALEKLMNTELEGLLKNPQTALSSEEQRIIRADIFALARRYIDQGGANAQTAYSQSMRDVFKMYGKPLPQAQPAKR